MITPAEFEDRMKEISVNKYIEDKHIDADKLMCKVLKDLGYVKGVEIFERMEKWYS